MLSLDEVGHRPQARATASVAKLGEDRQRFIRTSFQQGVSQRHPRVVVGGLNRDRLTQERDYFVRLVRTLRVASARSRSWWDAADVAALFGRAVTGGRPLAAVPAAQKSASSMRRWTDQSDIEQKLQG